MSTCYLPIFTLRASHESFADKVLGLTWEILPSTANRLRRLRLIARAEGPRLTVSAEATRSTPNATASPIGAWAGLSAERLLFVLRMGDRRLAAVTAPNALAGRLPVYANHAILADDAAPDATALGPARATLVTAPSTLRYAIGTEIRPVDVRLVDARRRQVLVEHAARSTKEVALDLRGVAPGDYVIEESEPVDSPLAQTRLHLSADSLPHDAIGLASIVPVAGLLTSPASFDVNLTARRAPLRFLILTSESLGASPERIRIVERVVHGGSPTSVRHRSLAPSESADDETDACLARSLSRDGTTAILFSTEAALPWCERGRTFSLTVDGKELVAALPLPPIDRPGAPSVIRLKF